MYYRSPLLKKVGTYLCIQYCNGSVMSEVHRSHEGGYASQMKQTYYARNNRVVEPGATKDGALAQEELERRDMVDEAVHSIATGILTFSVRLWRKACCIHWKKRSRGIGQ